MDTQQEQLWSQLKDFSIGPSDCALTFTQRLARENGWSLAYAERVVQEYKRFIVLMATSEQMLTPSDQVDQAWHLHLCYTRSYWHELCRDILQKELHHGPTQGGVVEGKKYSECYQRTLENYQAVFDTPPPPAIWPAVNARFANADRFIRINAADNWIIPIRQYWYRFTRPKALLGLGVFLAFAGVMSGIFFYYRSFFAFLVLVMLFMGIFIFFIKSAGNDPRRRSQHFDSRYGAGCGGCGTSGCSGCGGGCGGD